MDEYSQLGIARLFGLRPKPFPIFSRNFYPPLPAVLLSWGLGGVCAVSLLGACHLQGPVGGSGGDLHRQPLGALPPGLRRCLVSTNLIESPCSGMRMRTRRVGRWRDGAMVKRWAASTFLATEKNFRRLDGYRDLWILQAALDEFRFDSRKEVA